MELKQNEFLANLVNLAVVTLVNKTVADTTHPFVQSCLFDAVEYGDTALNISVDTLKTEDYSEESTLLKITKPVIDEQPLTTTDKKKIAVTLNRYVLKGAFANEYSISEAFTVILSMLQKTKNIYLYKKCVEAYENYDGGFDATGAKKNLLTTQTVTIDLIDVDQVDGVSEKKAAKEYNSNKIFITLQSLLQGMTSPSRLYNELGFETLSTSDDLKLVINGRFFNEMITYTLATLLNSNKISEKETWKETYVIPEVQFGKTETKKNVIGWFGDRNKYQIRPRFTVETSFNDASNLMQNNWLHFWLISGFVNGYPQTKLIANFVSPNELTDYQN